MTPGARFDGPEAIEQGLGAVGYLADAEIATSVFLADRLSKPVLIEGPAGTGKTELAKSVAALLRARLIRLQCYEGLDEAKVLYEWNYRKQLLRIQVARSGADPNAGPGWSELEEDIFSPEFLLTRPLLEAIRATDPVVLLIDEVDRVEIETEALLLEVLSEYQVSIPELGTVTATQIPLVFLTSNGTRELSEALKRRCLYLYLDYPSLEREREIVLTRVPGIATHLADEVVRIVRLLRSLDLEKHPSISETLDWARTLVLLGVEHADATATLGTLNLLLKYKNDIVVAQRELEAALPGDVAVLDVLDGFIGELRAAGIAVSVRETIDAAEAIEAVGLDRRSTLESALAATLVKTPEHLPIFRATFEVYFSLRGTAAVGSDGDADDAELDPTAAPESPIGAPGGTEDDLIGPSEVRRMATEALRTGDLLRLTAVARLAVELFGAVDPSRPVGVSYYLHRTLRGLDLDALVAALGQDPDRSTMAPELGPLGDRLHAEEAAERAEQLRELIEAEIRRRLVEARGAAQVARSLRRPLVEDVDFISATSEELAQMRRAIRPLARILATRLARRRRRGRRGPLDYRATIRRSLSTGGVPIDPRFRPPHPAQPELIVLADVSGSVASFARFTVHLVYAIAEQFAKVRTAVFIDGIDDVTDVIRRAASLTDAVEAIAHNAVVVSGDGHSDYGAALTEFHRRYARTVGHRTNVIVLGDARNNYHRAEAWVVQDLRRRAHKVYWLNPEPRAYWGSGDSIMGTYAPFCDGVFECRNLRQLRAFVDELA